MRARLTNVTVLFLLGISLPYTGFSQTAPKTCSEVCRNATDPAKCALACGVIINGICGRPEGQTCQQACAASSWPSFCSESFANPSEGHSACLQDCAAACADSCPDGDFKNPAEIAAKMVEDVENARFKLTPGFDVETGVSLSATSRIAQAFDIGGTDTPWCSFAVFDGKGELSSAEDATNHAEAALSSTVAYCRTRPSTSGPPVMIPVVVGLTADFRSKFGSFKEGQGDQQKTLEGNQSILGAGFTMLFPSRPAWLNGFELTAAYYTVVDSEGNLTVPKELEVDHVQARLRSRLLPFPDNGNQVLRNLALVVDGRGSWPQGGTAEEDDAEYYTSLALEIGAGKTAGTVRWEKGEEVGFKYDKKLVVGVIFRLLGLGED